MNRSFCIALLLALSFPGVSLDLHAETTIFARVTEILSGTSVEVKTIVSTQEAQRAQSLCVTLKGIALPNGQSIAYRFLNEELLGTNIRAVVAGDFSSGYVTGRIFNAAAEDIAEKMIRKGLVYRSNDDGIYERPERIAKFNAAGMWSSTWPEGTNPREQEAPAREKSDTQLGKFYKLRICGDDSLYQYGSATNCFIIQQEVPDVKSPRQFILICRDPRQIHKLEGRRSRILYVKLVNKAVLRSRDGDTTILPVLKEVGKSPYLGVRGEIMYFK
jgi:endonuclease YncB( thermonuclease family)